ncbi:MAG: hypothetical protein ABR963_04135 [Acidimicrobiales bacterium]
MMRPSNCALRFGWSPFNVARSTVKVPLVTVVPWTLADPQTIVVRPTAVVLCPAKTSSTR